MPQIYSSPTLYLLGFAILAAAGLTGTIWMERLHRAAVARCHTLEGEVVRVREARLRLVHFAADLVATLNLSLASCNGELHGLGKAQIESLRDALGEATQREPVQEASPWDPSWMPGSPPARS